MPQMLDYRNKRLKNMVDNKAKSSEAQPRPELTRSTRLISQQASPRGTHPQHSYQRLWGTEAGAAGKPNQFTAIQLHTEKHNVQCAQMNHRARTDPEEALGEKPRPPARGSTAPPARPAGRTEWLRVTAGHPAALQTSQALKLTSRKGITRFPRGTTSPLPFLLTTPDEGSGTCKTQRSRWQAEPVLHLQCYKIQFS